MAAEPFFLNIKKIHIAHRYTLDQNHKCAYPRGRGTYGLVYALQGSAEFRMAGGERAKVSQGDLLFLTPNVAYTVVPKVEFEHYTVNFELNGEDSFFGLLAEPYCLLRQESAEAMERCFRRFFKFLLFCFSTGSKGQSQNCRQEYTDKFLHKTLPKYCD